MRLHPSLRRVRIFTAAAAIVFVSVSAFAQSGQSRFDQPTLAAAAQTAGVRSTETVRPCRWTKR